jgi:hypothetical protein
MRVDGESHAVFGGHGLDAEEFRPVGQGTDNLVEQFGDRNISWVGQWDYSSRRILAQQ